MEFYRMYFFGAAFCIRCTYIIFKFIHVAYINSLFLSIAGYVIWMYGIWIYSIHPYYTVWMYGLTRVCLSIIC